MKSGIFLSLLLITGCSFTLFGFELQRQNLQAAADYSKARHGQTFLVMQGDRVVFESYQGSAGERYPIYSGTKTFWVMAAMIAVKEGLISLDEPVTDTIGEWKNNPQKARIKIRQLLDFTDGIEPASFLQRDTIQDRNALALSLPVVALPGTRFLYGPSHLQILGEVLRRKLQPRGVTPFEYLYRKVLNPLGLGHVEHKEDAMKQPLLATGFKLTAREWARMGSLLLHHGSYRGKEIVPPNLLAECCRPTRTNPAFGMGLWLNREAATANSRVVDIENLLELKWDQADWSNVCLSRRAPADMIVSLGSGYKRLYVIPSLDLVIVRQGVDAPFSDSVFLETLLGH